MSFEGKQVTYLERIKIEAFGAFSHKVVGPFIPGLNVIYGENETGKTTLASLVKGVLFGWEKDIGSRNSYKPANAERSGVLFFRQCPNGNSATLNSGDVCSGKLEEYSGTCEIEPEIITLERTKNAEGIQGPHALVDDIDKETFQTMFFLTSDELRSLRNTTDVTAKLLTAGSGTGASPAHALADVQERLATYTSKAEGNEHSLIRLSEQQEKMRDQLKKAGEQAERLKKQEKEYFELAPRRERLYARLELLNTSIEKIGAQRAALEKIDSQYSRVMKQVEDLRTALTKLSKEHVKHQTIEDTLINLGTADERSLRESIDNFADERAKGDHSVDLAQENCATSTAAYEALMETGSVALAHRKHRKQRRVQVVLSVVLPLVFVAAGVPLFMHGRDITSLSFTALGIGLVVFALVLAAASLVMLFRPDKQADALEARQQDTQWVMLQDRKKLQACKEAQKQLELRIRTFLDSSHLADARGSLRTARTLLDEAREVRNEEALFHQHRQALLARISSLDETIADARRQRQEVVSQLGGAEKARSEALDALLKRETRQRASLLEAIENLNHRCGELMQALAQGKQTQDFDELKLRLEQLNTQKKESAQQYARLLLSRRMLETAIAAWESKSQPEVYRQASRLLSLMTEGRWVKVAMNSKGVLQVMDAVRTTRNPVRLSLGTCQQLYLALRIALLMSADNVGRAIPILADDILVNFDARRRKGAVQALVELSHKRQVILFTCHTEIVDELNDVGEPLAVIEL